MKKEMKTTKVDSDFALITACAVRYALGRRTYITEFVSNYVKKFLKDFETKDLIIFKKDIERQRDSEFEDKPLGDDCDKAAWLSLLDEINAELNRRNN